MLTLTSQHSLRITLHMTVRTLCSSCSNVDISPHQHLTSKHLTSPHLETMAHPAKVGGGMEPDTDVGPLISPSALARAKSFIEQGIEHGAECLLDGRNVVVEEK